MRPILKQSALALSVAFLAACASGGGSAATSGAGSRAPIVATEIEETNLQGENAYNVVQRLRPNFLRVTGVGGFQTEVGTRADAFDLAGAGRGGSEIAVFIDGVNQGGVEVLRGIQARHVQRIEYMTASEAMAKLPIRDAVPAAIVLTLKK